MLVGHPFYSYFYEIFAPIGNDFYCYLLYITTNTTTMQIIFLFNSVVVVKYIFIFHLKNPTAIQDDFWTIFINVWSIAFAYISQFIFYMLPKRESNIVYKCLGRIPTELIYVQHDGNVPLNLTVLASLVLHFAFYMVKKVVKYYDNKKWQHLSKVKYQRDSRGNQQETIISTLTHVFGLLMVVVVLISIFQADNLDPLLINKFPHKLFPLVNHNIVPSFLVLFLSLFLMKRKPGLRREVLNEIWSVLLEYKKI